MGWGLPGISVAYGKAFPSQVDDKKKGAADREDPPRLGL
jgi:hypothetical protein